MVMLCCFGLTAAAQSYHVGDLYTAPDGSQGVVFYLHPDGSGGWVVALHDAPHSCIWGPAGDVPGLMYQNPDYNYQMLQDTAGYANTAAMRNAHPVETDGKYNAAWQVDFDNGWYLPAPGQLSILFGQIPFISSSIVSAGGTIPGSSTQIWYSDLMYWTSAQQSASEAWVVSFSTFYPGGFELKLKNFCDEDSYCGYLVRSVRSFTYTTVVHDSSLTYLWNTGSTEPSIEETPAQTTTYTVTATSEYGCRNTAAQTILVAADGSQTLYDTICQGVDYEANGFTLTAAETETAGIVTRTRTTEMNGCSATVTLELMVKAVENTVITQTANGSYLWNGVTYYESGDYTQYYTAANGCDSMVTLQLTIEHIPEVTILATTNSICAGDSAVLQAVIENAQEFAVPQAPPVAVGDILCTDGTTVKPFAYAASGKTAWGIVFFVDSTDEHGWAMDLHNLGGPQQGYQWSPQESSNIDVPTLDNIVNSRDAIADFDGYDNTQKLRAAGNSTLFPAAWAVDFDHGWYLPAIGQLTQLHAQIVTLNASLTLVGGSPFDLEEHYFFWSSTESTDGRAWNLVYGGSPRSDYKYYNNNRIRSVRNF